MRKKTKVFNAASRGFLELTIINMAGRTHHSGVTAMSWREQRSGTNIAIKAVQAPMMTAKMISLGQVILSPPKILDKNFSSFFIYYIYYSTSYKNPLCFWYNRDMKSERNILVAFLLNLAFSILQFLGGLLTNSVAIMTDSIHGAGRRGVGRTIVYSRASEQEGLRQAA